MPWPLRSNSSTSSQCSSESMPWLSAPGVSFNSSAARLKLPQRAAASNRRNPLSGGSLIGMDVQVPAGCTWLILVFPCKGSCFAMPLEVRHFLEEPFAKGDDLAPVFKTRRHDQPIAGRGRNNVVNGYGKPAAGNVVVDQRQAADGNAKSVGSRFQRQLHTAHDDLAGGGYIDRTVIAPGRPIVGGGCFRRGWNFDQGGARP